MGTGRGRGPVADGDLPEDVPFAERPTPFAGWSLYSISIAVWSYGRARPATPKPRR